MVAQLICTFVFCNAKSRFSQDASHSISRYHGVISREVAEDILARGGDGSYLVRKSERAENAYTLAIRYLLACLRLVPFPSIVICACCLERSFLMICLLGVCESLPLHTKCVTGYSHRESRCTALLYKLAFIATL